MHGAMKKQYSRYSCLVLVGLLSGCGPGGQEATEEKPRAPGTTAKAKGPDISTAEQAREAWRENRYPQAMEFYASQDLSNSTELLLERGRLFSEAGEFYKDLGALATDLERDLFELWEQRQQRGEMRSRFLSCFAAMGAYGRRDFEHSAALLERVQQEGAPEALSCRAQLAIAASYFRLGKVEKGRRLVQELEPRGKEDLGLTLLIYRTQVELGEVAHESSKTSSWNLERIEDPGLRNAALLDLAWLRLYEGNARQAFQLLQTYDPRRPLAEEDIEQQAQAVKVTRKYYGIAFLPLLARTCYQLASADLQVVAGEVGERGLYAAYLLGRALQEEGRWAEAESAFSRFIQGVEGQEEKNTYLVYLSKLARIYRGRALAELGQKGQASKLWEQIPGDEGLAGLSLKAALALEQTQISGEQPDPRELDQVAAQLSKIRPQQLSDEEFDYYYHAGLKTALLLRSGPKKQREDAVDLLERMHDKSSGYDPQRVEPNFLLSLSRAYYAANKLQWSLGKRIIGSLATVYPECTPVLEIYGYMLADLKAPGFGIQGEK